MQEIHKTIVAGGLIGLLVSGMLALPAFLPPAIAEEEPVRTLLKTGDELFPAPFDGNAFVKPPQFIVEPTVSNEVVGTRMIRKIGYGRTEMVEVTTTASGTYSTDGLESPHIRYPGIHLNPEWEAWQRTNVVAVWDGGWAAVRADGAKSFVAIVPRVEGCTEVGRTVYC